VPAPIKHQQVQLYMKSKDSGLSQETSAAKAGISPRTARRIESGTHRPNRGRPRDWKTRPDPLDGLWESELLPMLEKEPRLEALTLFEALQEQHPNLYDDKLRTVQRRVSDWKATQGKPKEVMFKIRHEPGQMGQSDFTHLKGVTVTIAGKPFHHLLYHYRLSYSGWQYVQVIQGGESFIGLSQGLQNALHASGGVPKTHRTDSLSAAYRNTGGNNPKLTQMYSIVCDHYRTQPTKNNTGVAHENGGIEGSHGYFKRRLCQALYRRGSFDFETVAQYQAFIEQVIAKLNGKCQNKFEIEQPLLQALPRYRTPDYEILTASVSAFSTITVRRVVYTVPSRLIGQRLSVHLYHDRLVGFLGTTQVVELERVHVPHNQKSRRGRSIHYQHVVESLRRKPRAFLYCQWQDDLLPNDQWRAIWESLKTQFDPDQAARLIVEALYIAATQDKEAAVAEYLQSHLKGGTLTFAGLQRSFESKFDAENLPKVTSTQHDLSSYDLLLESTIGRSLPDTDAPHLGNTPQRSPSSNAPHPDNTPERSPSSKTPTFVSPQEQSEQSLPDADDSHPDSSSSGQSLSVPDQYLATAQTQTFSRPVADHRTPGHSGKLVLRSVSPGFGPRRSQPSRAESDDTRALRGAVALRKILDEF
jgi:transcriptional regulator with XRE-family HTH domain